MFAYAIAGGAGPDRECAEDRATYVGGNFGMPHRDHMYNESFDDGRPAVLSLWHALCDVDTDSGCLTVVPRGADPRRHVVPCYVARRVASRRVAS